MLFVFNQFLGTTPMKIKIREATNLVLEKEQFVRRDIKLRYEG